MYFKKLIISLLLFSSVTSKIGSQENNTENIFIEEVTVKAKKLPCPEELINHIAYYEKYAPSKYQLPGDPRWYIGYGHSILPEEIFKDSISIKEAKALLIEDFISNKRIIKEHLRKDYSSNKISAITLLAYNCGPYKIMKWDLWDSLQVKGDCSIWLNYCCFNGKKHKGLLKRRSFEYEYFKN